MPRLFVLSGDDLGRTYDFTGPVVLGRGEGADVRLRSVAVSRAHARLEPTGAGGWRVVDLGSRNGVLVDDVRVAEAPLTDGTVFRLGELELRFRSEGQAVGEAGSLPSASVEPGAAEAKVSAPEPADLDPDGGLELEGGLQLEGDWEEVVPPPNRPTRAAAPPPQPQARQGGRAADRPAAAPTAGPAAEREARRAELLRRAGIAPPPRGVTTSGKPVLQYHRAAGGGGVLGSDLAQAPWWQRVLVGAIAVAALVGLVYGAVTLTRTLRQGNAPAVDPAEAEDTTFFGGDR
jgi:pSer/pThr/pTyr-binding forkhead associated (FHA) protein